MRDDRPLAEPTAQRIADIACGDADATREEIMHLARCEKRRRRIVKLLPVIVEAASRVWIQPEYDFPAHTPELCGYKCEECHEEGPTEDAIEHRPLCKVAECLGLITRGGER